MSSTRKGHVYKIICTKSNDVYVGSTFNAPRTRFASHNSSWDGCKGLFVYDCFSRFKWSDLKMVVIETYDVVDKMHLEMYEQLWINKLRAVNKSPLFSILRSKKGSSQTYSKKIARQTRLSK